MNDGNGIDVLRALKQTDDPTPTIMISGHATISDAVEAPPRPRLSISKRRMTAVRSASEREVRDYYTVVCCDTQVAMFWYQVLRLVPSDVAPATTATDTNAPINTYSMRSWPSSFRTNRTINCFISDDSFVSLARVSSAHVSTS